MHIKHRLIILSFLVAGLLTLLFIPVFAQDDEYKNTEIIVKFKEPGKMTKSSLGNELPEIGPPKYIKVKPDSGETVNEILNYYKNDPAVEYAEPNIRWSIQYIPNDTYYSKQWALPKINMPSAWEITRGNANVVVAVIDTGVDINHPELAGKMVDGYNAITEMIGNSYAQDDQGHGTHISGTICAAVNNGKGISGIADNIMIMPVKVLGSDGSGWTDDISNGIIWAADHHADVINLSLGSDQSSNLIEDAIEYAYSKGVVIVAAAGNTGQRGVLYPAAGPNVIGVSATDKYDQLYTGSSYGAEVDISAPGADIYSTIWLSGGVSSYNSLTGTSMATSVVSGGAALVFSTYPDLTNAQVETVLKESAVDLGISGWDEKYGYGRLDAFSALNYAEDTFIPDSYQATFDLNWDGFNSMQDLYLLSKHYGEKIPNSIYDLNNDGVTDMFDLVRISRQL